MNNQIGNRDKRIAMLLIAAFAWLFIGSLIIFHQEHVLGKHFRMNTQLFISPKTKDKKDQAYNILKPVMKFVEQGNSAGIFSEELYTSNFSSPVKIHAVDASSILPDDDFITHSALRGPPEA